VYCVQRNLSGHSTVVAPLIAAGFLPGVGVDGGETLLLAPILEHTSLSTGTEIEAADKNLVLAGYANRAEPPDTSLIVVGTSLSCGPREVGRARTNLAHRVAAGLVKAERNGVRRKPSNGRIFQSTRDAVNVQLKGLLADLKRLLAVPILLSRHRGTYRIGLSVIVDEEDGQLGVPPLVVLCGNNNTLL
jgi:hypothetical protein